MVIVVSNSKNSTVVHSDNLLCLLSADFFQNQLFLKNSFRNTIRVSNSLEPDQARHFVGPDLGPNCLQRLSADDSQRVDDTRVYGQKIQAGVNHTG